MSLLEIFSLLGGVGLFLLGMTVMSSGLRNACGNNLQVILERATANKYIAVLMGMAMTVLIQSSSATDVMVIGFVNAEMMSLAQAIGVIMGANIGTTVTAQITAFNLSAYTPLLLFGGAVMYLFIKKSIVKHIGEIVMGFGMLFQGITIMKAAIAPLQHSQGFVQFISNLSNPFIAVLFGVAVTALLQSSSSSTVIFQTFAVQGLLDYHTAVYLVIGAAIGSVTPNILASLTTNRNGKRTALLNLTFNIIRAILLCTLIGIFPRMLDLIQGLSPGDVGRQIANTHTIFAIIAVCVELPFTNQIIRLVQRIIPVLPEESAQAEERKLVYMTGNTSSLAPQVAMNQAQKEITRMGRIAAKNLHNSLDCFFNYTPEKAESVRSREETVNILNQVIADAMAGLSRMDLSRQNLRRVSMMTITVTDIERLSDHAENIVEYAEALREGHAVMSDEAVSELRRMAKDSMDEVNVSLDIFETGDFGRLTELEALEARVDEQEGSLVQSHVRRLMVDKCDPMAGVVFCDMVTDLERCGDHAVNIAYTLHERALASDTYGNGPEASADPSI